MLISKENFTDEVLKRLQMTQVEILDEVVRVCDKFGLKYYLAEGTLLGAVRHKGHIPWDDDLDIAMPREDFNRFAELCKTELDEKYQYQFTNTIDNHYLSFAKVRKKNTLLDEYNVRNLDVPKGIYIDIFPLDNTNNKNPGLRKIKTNIIKKLSFPVTAKVGLEYTKTISHSAFLFILKPFSAKQINNFRTKLMSTENRKETKFFVSYASYCCEGKELFEKELFGDGVMLEFNGKLYKAPCQYDKVLTIRYGNYMQLPPVEERIQKHKPEHIDFGD